MRVNLIRGLLGAVVLVIFSLGVYRLSATTNCEQTFHFRAMTGYDPAVFWLTEDIGGECLQSRLLQLAVRDSTVMVLGSDLKEFQNWAWLEEGMTHLNRHTPVEFSGGEGRWQNWEKRLIVQTPAKDPQFAAAFDAHMAAGGRNGASWNQSQGEAGRKLPVIRGGGAKLLYYHPQGLYVNYDIDQIYYFDRLQLLLVLTRHEYRAMGLDTMHGFMILKLNTGDAKE